jgi:hypothetical protein
MKAAAGLLGKRRLVRSTSDPEKVTQMMCANN